MQAEEGQDAQDGGADKEANEKESETNKKDAEPLGPTTLVPIIPVQVRAVQASTPLAPLAVSLSSGKGIPFLVPTKKDYELTGLFCFGILAGEAALASGS